VFYRQCLHGLWVSINVGQPSLIFKHENREMYKFYSFPHPYQSLSIDPGHGLRDPGHGLRDPGHGLQDPGHGLQAVLDALRSLFIDGVMYVQHVFA
jgi:hypothetical protein